jgi:hypothetical protein
METFHSEKIHACKNQPMTHDVVSIKNGKGYKLREVLNKNGKAMNRTRKALNKSEIRHIMNGRFLPGLWKNCGSNSGGNRGASSRKKSRYTSRR